MVIARIIPPAGEEPSTPLQPIPYGGYVTATPESALQLRPSLSAGEGDGGEGATTLVTVPISLKQIDEKKELATLKERLLKLLGRQKTIERLEATSASLVTRLHRSLRVQSEVEASLQSASFLNACCSSNFEGVAGCFRVERDTPRQNEKEGDELTKDLWRMQQEQAKDIDEICQFYAGQRTQEAAKDVAIVEMEKQMKVLEGQLAEKAEEVSALRGELLEAQRAASDLHAQAEELAHRLRERESECEHAVTSHRTLLRENVRAKQSVTDTQHALSTMQEFLQDMHVKVKGQLGKKDDEIRDLKKILAQRDDENARLRQQLNSSWRESDQAIGRELDWKLEYGRLVKEAGSLRAELEQLRSAGGDSQRTSGRGQPPGPPAEPMSLASFIMRTFGGSDPPQQPQPQTPPQNGHGRPGSAQPGAASRLSPSPARYYDGTAGNPYDGMVPRS